MSKPNWSDAPEWAKYLAIDSDGEWYWYEFEPHPLYRTKKWWPGEGRCHSGGKTEPLTLWIDSLKVRPE